MSAPYSLVPGLPQPLHLAQTTGNGGILYLQGNCARVTIVLQSNGTTSGGTVSIEEAYYDLQNKGEPVYSGTWSVLEEIDAATFTGSQQLVKHLAGSFWAVRVRVSSDITGGGTISFWAWGN